MKLLIEDIKLYALNSATLVTTIIAPLETALKIILLLLSIGYTGHKWYLMKNENKDKK